MNKKDAFSVIVNGFKTCWDFSLRLFAGFLSLAMFIGGCLALVSNVYSIGYWLFFIPLNIILLCFSLSCFSPKYLGNKIKKPYLFILNNVFNFCNFLKNKAKSILKRLEPYFLNKYFGAIILFLFCWLAWTGLDVDDTQNFYVSLIGLCFFGVMLFYSLMPKITKIIGIIILAIIILLIVCALIYWAYKVWGAIPLSIILGSIIIASAIKKR